MLTISTPSNIGFVGKHVGLRSAEKINRLQKEIGALIAIPKPAKPVMRPLRTTEIRPSTIVNLEARNATKSSCQVAEVMRTK